MGKSSGGGGQNTVVQQSAPNPQFLAAYQNANNIANQVASEPYTPYSGPLVAGFTPQQQAGFQDVNTAINAGYPYLNAASNTEAAATNLLSPNNFGSTVSNYYSPFTSNVVGTTEALQNQQNEVQQQQLAGNAVSAGAWGGDRAAVAQANLAENQQLAEAPVIANLENTGWQNATNAAESNAWLNSQGSFAYGNLGQEAENLGLTGANALINSGSMQQQLAQQELNVPYQQYQAAQAYPFQTAGWLAGISEGLGSGAGGTSSTNYPGASPLSQIAGLGVTGVGAAGLLNNSGLLSGLGGAGAAGAGALGDTIALDAGATAAEQAAVTAGAGSAIGDIALASARRGGRIGLGGLSDRLRQHRRRGGGSIPGFQYGGGSPGDPSSGQQQDQTPAGLTASVGGNPMVANLLRSYQGLPTEKLQEIASRLPPNSPQGGIVRRALQGRLMNPAADPSRPTASPQSQQSGMTPYGTPTGLFSAGGRAQGGGMGSYDDSWDDGADLNIVPDTSDTFIPGSPAASPPTAGFGPTGGGGARVNQGGPPPAPPIGVNGFGPGVHDLPPGATPQQLMSGFGSHPADRAALRSSSHSPWETLIDVGLGIMGGTSPQPGVNIGQGALRGLQVAQSQRRLEQEDQYRRDNLDALNAYRANQTNLGQQRVDTGNVRAATGQQSEIDRTNNQRANTDLRTRAADVLYGTAGAPGTVQQRTNIAGFNADTRANQGDRRLDQGDRRLDQGDVRLDQGNQNLDIRRQEMQLREQAQAQLQQQRTAQNTRLSAADAQRIVANETGDTLKVFLNPPGGKTITMDEARALAQQARPPTPAPAASPTAQTTPQALRQPSQAEVASAIATLKTGKISRDQLIAGAKSSYGIDLSGALPAQ